VDAHEPSTDRDSLRRRKRLRENAGGAEKIPKCPFRSMVRPRLLFVAGLFILFLV
jgi:hypothetical protein